MWNLHSFYTNRETGLIGQLVLSDKEETKLKELRHIVRKRITLVFNEAIAIAKEIVKNNLTINNVSFKLQSTFIRHLSPEEQNTVAELINEMDLETLREFIQLKPRFMTQGSFQYKTLNKPFHPGQEMDIDDGTYLPMPIFESKPKIGHQLLTLLVDSALKSLANENRGWKFEAKRTCGRIKITDKRTHIDVPMYAIPREQFLQKEAASMLSMDSNRKIIESKANLKDEESYRRLDSDCVNLALRDDKPGSPKWMNSDPKVVEDWFIGECRRIGFHLRDICRFMKAWRDAQWNLGGPSSICLMAATVEVLNKKAHDTSDIASVVKIVAENLPYEFRKGVESPDDTDERPLFPPESEHNDREKNIICKLEDLSTLLSKAENAETKLSALNILSEVFGERVKNISLIKVKAAALAFESEPAQANSPAKISTTMVSG